VRSVAGRSRGSDELAPNSEKTSSGVGRGPGAFRYRRHASGPPARGPGSIFRAYKNALKLADLSRPGYARIFFGFAREGVPEVLRKSRARSLTNGSRGPASRISGLQHAGALAATAPNLCYPTARTGGRDYGPPEFCESITRGKVQAGSLPIFWTPSRARVRGCWATTDANFLVRHARNEPAEARPNFAIPYTRAESAQGSGSGAGRARLTGGTSGILVSTA
jgi:hypothetical protein